MSTNTTIRSRTNEPSSLTERVCDMIGKVSLWTPVPIASFLLWSSAIVLTIALRFYPDIKNLLLIEQKINETQQELTSGRSLIGVRWQQVWLIYGKSLVPSWLLSRTHRQTKQPNSTATTILLATEKETLPSKARKHPISRNLQSRINSLGIDDHYLAVPTVPDHLQLSRSMNPAANSTSNSDDEDITSTGSELTDSTSMGEDDKTTSNERAFKSASSVTNNKQSPKRKGATHKRKDRKTSGSRT
ncbi:hypothetical protein BDF19DRAFT_428417 [Syncephalis fuscata]|nr:hypothetical protein BDF19DRAFT_428417 [Syncephalis fuscata]